LHRSERSSKESTPLWMFTSHASVIGFAALVRFDTANCQLNCFPFWRLHWLFRNLSYCNGIRLHQ
jgi:hypothetical protein